MKDGRRKHQGEIGEMNVDPRIILHSVAASPSGIDRVELVILTNICEEPVH